MTEPRRASHSEPHCRRWIGWVYALLFAASVPWYLPRGKAPALWWGLPYWVVLSLAATLAVAGFTAWVIHRYWDDGASASSDEGGAR